MATINPSQDYDIIHTLTYASSGGADAIQLYRGSLDYFTGTVYYRAGTSGAWTSLSVSGSITTFPITSTTMQIAHNWNKSGSDYMTPSFSYGTMTGIAISQKATLSGGIGNNFMQNYAEGCESLTALDVPDTSGLTSVGDFFMTTYASYCTDLAALDVPDTSGLTSVGNNFMSYYAYDCNSITTLEAPDTSGVTSIGNLFMAAYAYDCDNLTTLAVPDTSGLVSAGNYFLYFYASYCPSLTSLDVPDTSGLVSVGNYFMHFYANSCSGLTTLAVPDTSGLVSAGSYFMTSYADGCSGLVRLELPNAGWFKTHNVDWSVPSGRLGVLKGRVSDVADLADWRALTVSGKTLYTNYIRDSSLVVELVTVTGLGAIESTSISTLSISKTASLSVQGHGVSTSMSTPDIQLAIVLGMDSIGTSTSMSEPSMVLIKGVLPNSMSIGVSADNLGLLLKAGVLPDNMEIVTASSIPSISGDILIFTDDMLVGLNEDEVSVGVLRDMDVDTMSIIPAILATAVQMGYPTNNINADNIYAIGSMREGEYGIATINNNQIYEVIEHDGI